MLKTIRSPNEPTFSRNDGSKPAFGRNDGNSEVDRFGGNDVEYARKSKKSKKLSKSQKLSKSGKSKGEKSKKPSKSRNSPNINATEAGPSFLTANAEKAFHCLWLAFTKALILQLFDWEYHIWIKTDVSGYAICHMLSQLASGTRPDGIVTKIDFG